jgi:hypothetical protein
MRLYGDPGMGCPCILLEFMMGRGLSRLIHDPSERNCIAREVYWFIISRPDDAGSLLGYVKLMAHD